jgi:hypothetical protein
MKAMIRTRVRTRTRDANTAAAFIADLAWT